MNQTPNTVIAESTPPSGTLQATLETVGNQATPAENDVPSKFDYPLMLKALVRLRKWDLKWSADDKINSLIKTTSDKDFDFPLLVNDFREGMAALALHSHRFFTGSPCLHFFLPKMDIQTGVLGFRFVVMQHDDSGFPSNPIQTNYTQWDISQQNYFIYQIPNFQPYKMRSLDMVKGFTPQYIQATTGATILDIDYSEEMMQQSNNYFGRLKISVDHPLVGGSIAPRTVTILCHFNFPNTELTNLCALRAGAFTEE